MNQWERDNLTFYFSGVCILGVIIIISVIWHTSIKTDALVDQYAQELAQKRQIELLPGRMR